MAEHEHTGDVLDKYTFLEKLGEGSFGEVWQVRDPAIGEMLALKYLRLDRASEEYLELFKREFEILSEIRHTNLAHVFDFGYSPREDKYFFTSEFCPGRDFIEAAAGKPYEYVEDMLVQTLSALDYVHSQGIIHFDIKSENVLVSETDGKPHVKILDFGVAAKLKALPQGVAGTPSYMAPEIIVKGGTIDHRVDLYSLGILLLRTLTGKLPFDTDDTDAVLHWQVKGELSEAIWDGVKIPHYMRDLIEKLLAKKPANRFSNARVALHFINASTGRKYLKVEQDLAGKIPREGPLVEREEILEKLRDAFNEALFIGTAKNPLQICTISGAQGMGKSRILEEMRHMIELREIPFFEAVCDWQVPAWPRIEKWLNIAGAVSAQMGEEWQMRVRIDAMIKKAKEQPYCLLIDDFHKADRTTKALLPALASKLALDRLEGRSAPLFILAATEEMSKDAIPLKRLSSTGIAQYIKLVLGETERGDAVGKMLHQYSGGLPLLMVEGLRFLAPHLYKDEPLENLLPPPQIGLLYRDKMDALRDDERDFLDILALLFRPATEDELANILGSSVGVITGLAEACLRNELIGGGAVAEDEHAEYQISSQALSLDIIRSIEPERSQKLHRKISRGLGKIDGTPLNEIAYHTAKGGDVDTAIGYYKDAATQFKDQRQISTATDCLVKAINLCTPGVPVWRDLVQEAARLLVVAGSYREAGDYLQKMQDYSTFSIEELRGMYAMKVRQLDSARSAYERALKLVPKGQDYDRILIENSLANVELQAGDFNKAIEIFRLTLDETNDLSPEEQRKISNNSLGLALALTGQTEEALAFYEDQLKRADPTKTAEIASLENGMGYVLFQASRYDEAIPHLHKAMEMAEHTGAMHALFSSMGNLISALLKEARYDETLPLLQKMSDYQERLGSPRDLIYNLLREGSVYLTVGMEEAAKNCFMRGRKLSQDMKDLALAAWFILLDGYREREYGGLKKARECFLLAEYEAHEHGDKDLIAWSHYSLADLAIDEGNENECRQKLESIAEPPKDDEFICRLALLRARLGAATHDGPVEALFKPLEETCRRDQLKELHWEVYHRWARAEIERDNTTAAIPLLLKGIKIIETISTTLPEEYRDSYMRQRSRSKLFKDFKELTQPSRAEKVKPAEEKVFAAKPRKAEGTMAEGSTLKVAEKGTAEGTVYTGPKTEESTLKKDTKPTAEGTIYTGPAAANDDDADEPTIKVDAEEFLKKKKEKK